MLKKLAALAAVIIAAVITAATASAAQRPAFGFVASPEARGNTDVNIQEVGGEHYLFLPSSADLTRLRLSFRGGAATLCNGTVTREIESGEPFDFTRLFPENAENYTLYFVQRSRHIKFTVMRSENIRSLFITSGDPENRDREWIELSKDNRAGGSAVLLRSDGSVAYAGGIKSLRGRGNSTWNYPKKPYQIKLAAKSDLLDTGKSEKASDTWLLLANYIDGTLVHNSLTLDLGRELGVPYPVDAEPVDLYYDGEYRGSYLLTEKVEVGEGRVDIRDLEAEIEKENPSVTESEMRSVTVKSFTDESAFKFTEWLDAPDDISGGYLMELELDYRALSEENWFKTAREQYVVMKSPERVPHEAMLYVMGLYTSFEDAVFNGGTDPATGRDYRELCDLESLARTYVIMEFCADNDAFRSSTFIIKKAGDEKLYFAPLWDFDTGYGSANISQEFYVAGRSPLGSALMAIPSFRERVREIYETELTPLIENVILGDESARGKYLRSIASYIAETEASRRMNDVLWTKFADLDATENFTRFVSVRHKWLSGEMEGWSEDAPIGRSFVDVSIEDWYYSAVAFVSDKGLIAGTSDVTFSPSELMTLEATVKAANALAGAEIPGIADGFSDLSAPVTRGELATVLYRLAEYAGADTSARADLSAFSDGAEVDDADAMSWAVYYKITTGVGGRTAWNENISRAYAAVFIYRAYLYVLS